MPLLRSLVLVLLSVVALGCKKPGSDAAQPLTLGFFPNITHAQALVGHRDGTFQRSLGARGLSVKQFNAGPSAMEAMLAGSLDIAYVGSGPAINTYVKSGGAIRVVAGSSAGGAVFVTRTAKSAAELKGKTVASPQLGNTQDIALRIWLRKHGYDVRVGQTGEVKIINVANPDILGLFKRGEIEGAWVPEPWGARLVHEAGGRILVDERELWEGGQFPTTLVVVTKSVLERRREEVKAIVRAHVELTERYRRDPPGFVKEANSAYGELTRHPLPGPILKDAFDRLTLSTDPLPEQLALDAQHAGELGFLKTVDITGLIDASVLEEVKGTPASTTH